MKNQTSEVNAEIKLPAHVTKRLEAERRWELHETINEFYGQAGLLHPVDNLLSHIQALFNCADTLDDSEKDPETGEVKRLYQKYTPDGLSDQIFTTFNTVRFLIKLYEDFEVSPDNPRNIKSQ